MSELFTAAAKRNKKRMAALYEHEKSSVYYLCSLLLPDRYEPAETTELVFRRLWEELPAWNCTNDAEGSGKLKKLAVSICAEKLKRADRQVFKRADSAFSWSDCNAGLPCYTPAERFTVLSSVYEAVGSSELSKILGITEYQVKASLASAQEKLSPEQLRIQLSMNEAKCVVPEQVDRKVRTDIAAFKTPKKPIAKKFLWCGWAAIVLIAVVICSVAALNHEISVSYDYIAEINVEDYGTITVALDSDAAPITVRNFVDLANSGFYDGLTFHRIIEGFMIQGGDPLGDGTGGSDETIKGEFSENGVNNTLSHTRGAISMARSNDYNSASSQFFIVQEDSTFLDGQYACFGYVTDGMDVVDAICADADPTDNNGTIASEDQPVITSVTIRAFDAE